VGMVWEVVGMVLKVEEGFVLQDVSCTCIYLSRTLL